MKVSLEHPWLIADLGGPRRVLSWSLTAPGFVEADRIIWREVRDADLTEELDAVAWFSGELARRHAPDAVGFLTSRAVSRYKTVRTAAGDASAHAIATVGLSNAERVGAPRRAGTPAGTINIAVSVEQGLTDAALIETLSVATAARTAAIMDHGPRLGAGQATGTGTDCIAVAAQAGDAGYAGLHTDVGEAVGRAVYKAVAAGATEWMAEQGG